MSMDYPTGAWGHASEEQAWKTEAHKRPSQTRVGRSETWAPAKCTNKIAHFSELWVRYFSKYNNHNIRHQLIQEHEKLMVRYTVLSGKLQWEKERETQNDWLCSANTTLRSIIEKLTRELAEWICMMWKQKFWCENTSFDENTHCCQFACSLTMQWYNYF